MGNIQHRRIKSLFPSSQNLDNPSTKSEDNNHHQNSTQQFTTSFNPKKQTLLQLTLSDNAEIQSILSNISLYYKQSKSASNGGYPSISSLKEYYKVKKQGYCTQQQIFYLIFQGCSCCGLNDQFGVRKMLNKKFTDQDILSILKTYLTGIFLYIKQFKRNIQKIGFEDIGFEIFNPINNANFLNQNQQIIQINQRQNKRKIRLFFIEPWIKQKKQQQTITVNQVNILLQNPSPQRLLENSNKIGESFLQKQSKQKNNYPKYSQSQKQFFSLLFSIGIIGLKLLQMGFVDDVYLRSPSKKVNYEKIQAYLEKFQGKSKNQGKNMTNGLDYQYSVNRKKLIEGLRILLLSNLPEERQKIFQFWGMKLDDVNCLQEINIEYLEHFQTGRQQPGVQQVNYQNRNPIVQSNHLINHFHNQRPGSNSFSGKLYEVQNPIKNEHVKTQTQVKNFIGQVPQVPSQQSIINNRSNSLTQKQANLNRNYVYKLNQIKPSNTGNIQMNPKNHNHPNIRENHQIQPIFSQQNHINLQRKSVYLQGPNPNQKSFHQNLPLNFIKQDTNFINRPVKIGTQEINSKTYLSQKSTQQGSILYTGL